VTVSDQRERSSVYVPYKELLIISIPSLSALPYGILGRAMRPISFPEESYISLKKGQRDCILGNCKRRLESAQVGIHSQESKYTKERMRKGVQASSVGH
jgi:hypothetical protein